MRHHKTTNQKHQTLHSNEDVNAQDKEHLSEDSGWEDFATNDSHKKRPIRPRSRASVDASSPATGNSQVRRRKLAPTRPKKASSSRPSSNRSAPQSPRSVKSRNPVNSAKTIPWSVRHCKTPPKVRKGPAPTKVTPRKR